MQPLHKCSYLGIHTILPLLARYLAATIWNYIDRRLRFGTCAVCRNFFKRWPAGSRYLSVQLLLLSGSQEGSFALGAMQAVDNGPLDAALTCYELTNTFIHIFLLAPVLSFGIRFCFKKQYSFA